MFQSSFFLLVQLLQFRNTEQEWVKEVGVGLVDAQTNNEKLPYLFVGTTASVSETAPLAFAAMFFAFFGVGGNMLQKGLSPFFHCSHLFCSHLDACLGACLLWGRLIHAFPDARRFQRCHLRPRQDRLKVPLSLDGGSAGGNIVVFSLGGVILLLKKPATGNYTAFHSSDATGSSFGGASLLTKKPARGNNVVVPSFGVTVSSLGGAILSPKSPEKGNHVIFPSFASAGISSSGVSLLLKNPTEDNNAAFPSFGVIH